MFKKILIALVVLIGGLAAFVAAQPSTFRIERSTTLPAPAEIAFPLVNDFHGWARWSPWAKLDPNQKTTYEGAASGTGAIQYWTGNDDVGEGRMTITESRANEFIGIKLEFIRPFASTNQTEFTFTPAGNEVKVNWAMHGENNFMSKAFGLFMDMDAMIGKDFEKGLAALKLAAEADAKKAAEAAPAAAEAAE
ncbi:MAG: SRPBCC family protein, partial [Myxococcaceae bacterium]